MQKTVSRILTIVSIAISVTLCSTGVATAQEQCAKRADMIEFMSSKHGQTSVSLGVDAAGNLVEVLSSAQGARWSIIVTSPGENKVSCIVGTGEGWRTLAPAIHDTGA